MLDQKISSTQESHLECKERLPGVWTKDMKCRVCPSAVFPGVCQESAYRNRIWKKWLKTPLLSEAVGGREVPGQPVWFWASPRRESPKSLRATRSQSSSPQQQKVLMFKWNSFYFRWCPLPLVLLLGTTEEYWTPSFRVILYQEFIHMDKIPLGFPFSSPSSPSLSWHIKCPKPISEPLKNRFVPLFRATFKMLW